MVTTQAYCISHSVNLTKSSSSKEVLLQKFTELTRFGRTCLLFSLICWLGIVHISAQAPAGYTLCATEGGSFTLPSRSHVAYGANGKYKYLFNQVGTITFSNDFFAGDPAPGIVKSGYYKLVDLTQSATILRSLFLQLKNHIQGTKVLTGTRINQISDTIQQNIFVIADSLTVVTDAFDLIDTYDLLIGPMFLNPATKGGFANNFAANDGKELARVIFLVQQGILDYIYTAQNTQKYKGFLNGKKFKTANYFPGICPAPIDSTKRYTAKINGSMPTEYGKRTAFSSTPARRPTGYYLAPGSYGTVKVPANLVKKGFRILVGAHSFERTGNNPVRRLFRITSTFPIEDTLTQIANPLGGGIYIITPYQANEGVVDIELSNVVPAPFFSAKTFHQTTEQEWLDIQRKNPAPWADFESDKYMMQVPTSWIYNYKDATNLMTDWDQRMDEVSRLLGYPLERNHAILYLQIDVDIMYGFYGIGNPQINNAYSPYDVENGNKNHWFLKPGVDFWETEFHEMGHAQLFSKFPGETEAAVNVPAAAIYNRLYKMDIDSALGNSFNNQPQISRDQAALNWMVTPNFRAGKPMDISNTTKDEVRYQQRGYAKYIEMAALFGWESIDSFYKKEQLDFINKVPSDGLNEIDSRLLRFARTTGVDVRPLIHFWGTHPKDSAKIRQLISAENFKPSKLICDRLTHYKSILPLNNADFVKHAKAFFGGSVPAGGDPDYGSGWYNVWLPLYNTTHGAQGAKAMQDIINLYFPGGCPAAEAPPTVVVNSPSICPGQSTTLTAKGAAYYLWSNGATGESITVNPTQTTTYTVVGKKAGVSSIPITATVTVNPIPTISVKDTTICAGQTAQLNAIGATTYAWSNGETTNSILVSPTITTTYRVIGSALGCTSSEIKATVTVNPIPTISVKDTTICAGQMASLTASGATNYAWSNGETTNSISVSPSQSTTYGVTGSTLGCTSNEIKATVTVNPIPVIAVKDTAICAGQTALLSASGATTYAWSNGETTNSILVSPSQSTTYTVVGSALGCTSNETKATVTVNAIPVISVPDTTICAGQTALLSASGATTYTWSNGETTNSILVSPSQSTTYTVVGNTLGCVSNEIKATVTVNPLPIITLNDTTICAGQTALLSASGATTYAWSNGETTNSILVSPSLSTTYSVIGKTLGCASNEMKATVTVNPIPVISVMDTTICAGQTALLSASGATTYAWSNGETTNSISVSPSQSTTYSVLGSSLGCVSNEMKVTVNVNPIPVISAKDTTICAGQLATLTASGASSYAWSNGASSSVIQVSPATSTSYTVKGTALGCSSNEIKVTVNVNPLPNLVVNDTSICQGQSVIVLASGAESYLWSTGASDNSIKVSPNKTASYGLTGTTNGCSSSDTITVVVNELPVVDLGADFELAKGKDTTLNATGPGLSYNWSTGATTPIILVSKVGVYVVTVTNGAGCTAVDSIRIKVKTNNLDLDDATRIAVQPNPTFNLLQVTCFGKATTLVEVVDLLGQVVLSDTTIIEAGVPRMLYLENLPAGLYYLRVSGVNFIKTEKVIKQ